MALVVPGTIERAEAHSVLEDALGTLNLAVESAQVDALLSLAELLHRWAPRINLTGYKTFAALLRGLVVESAALTSVLPDLQSLADIGSGAGFPGLPIAILRPRCGLTLVEARRRRHHFQKAAIRELGLENVTPLLGRAESLAPVRHAAAIAQAMAQPDCALSRMLPWVERGGCVLIPGSESIPVLSHKPDVEFEGAIAYRVPGRERTRTLWVGRVSR